MSARRGAVIAAAFAGLAGCAQLMGLDGDPYVTTTDAGWTAESNDASPPGSPWGGGAPADSGGPDEARADASAPACNTGSDPNNCGQCGHVCTIGRCEGGYCTPVAFANAQEGVSAIVADNQEVYWLTSTALVSCPAASCGGPTPRVSGLNLPEGLAMDPSYVYWSSSGWDDSGTGTYGAIGQFARGGGGASVLVNGVFASPIAVGQGWLVWFSGVGAGLFSCQLPDCAPTSLRSTGIAIVPHMAFDPSATAPLYINDNGTGSCIDSCGSVSGSCDSPTSAACFTGEVLSFTMDEASVYVSADQLYSCPVGVSCGTAAGAGAAPLVLNDAGAGNLVVQNKHLFWVGSTYSAGLSTETVYTCPVSNCASPLALLAPGAVTQIGAMAVNDRFVYIADSSSQVVYQISR